MERLRHGYDLFAENAQPCLWVVYVQHGVYVYYQLQAYFLCGVGNFGASDYRIVRLHAELNYGEYDGRRVERLKKIKR